MLMKNILAMSAVAILAACTTPTQPHSSETQSVSPTSLNQKWKLTQFQSFSQKDLAQAVLDLSELPRAHATVGCNQMNFQAATSPENTWQVKGIAMTRMHCEEVAKLEMAFAKSIQAAQTYRLENNRLILQTASGETMIFEAAP